MLVLPTLSAGLVQPEHACGSTLAGIPALPRVRRTRVPGFSGKVPLPTLGCLVLCGCLVCHLGVISVPLSPSFPASCTRTVIVAASPPVFGHACQSNTQAPLAWRERQGRKATEALRPSFSRFVFITPRIIHRTLWVWDGWSMHVSRRQASEQRSTSLSQSHPDTTSHIA